MAIFTSILHDIRQLSSFSEKASFLTVILNSFKTKKGKITAEDKQELSAFVFEEIKRLNTLIPTLPSYKEKNEVFEYENNLVGLVMLCHASPAEINETDLNDLKALLATVEKERFVENAIDHIFRDGQNDKATVSQLLASVTPLRDEYHKGVFYQGLLHYRNEIEKLPLDSKILLADYIASELARYLDTPLEDTIVTNLELVSDAARFFINDQIVDLLNKVLKLGKNNINYYAVSSLLSGGQRVPQDVIVSLANDLIYADLTYALVKQHGLTALFPAELSNPEYLAKSDLIHWLTYPTELGKVPDQIEFLGKVKKKEEYYIFRYTSDSDTLDDESKGKWLIGWSNDEGGTFSNFDLYSDYEKASLEKTLKNIKKRLL